MKAELQITMVTFVFSVYSFLPENMLRLNSNNQPCHNAGKFPWSLHRDARLRDFYYFPCYDISALCTHERTNPSNHPGREMKLFPSYSCKCWWNEKGLKCQKYLGPKNTSKHSVRFFRSDYIYLEAGCSHREPVQLLASSVSQDLQHQQRAGNLVGRAHGPFSCPSP